MKPTAPTQSDMITAVVAEHGTLTVQDIRAHVLRRFQRSLDDTKVQNLACFLVKQNRLERVARGVYKIPVQVQAPAEAAA